MNNHSVAKFIVTNADVPPFDDRRVANLLLDLAAKKNLSIYHTALHKLLYFAHGFFLIKHKRPLLRVGFEAWPHGPVSPVVYQAFEDSSGAPIKARAMRFDLLAGEYFELPGITDSRVVDELSAILDAFGSLSAGQLESISHAERGPWDIVSKYAKNHVVFGLRIPDDVTVDGFKFLKIAF
jgi:uncharacterized phage-associated protein